MDQLGSEQSPLEVIASKFPGTFDGIILTLNQGILSCYIISVWVHSIFLECMKWCNDGCLAMGKGTTKLWNLSSFSFTCCLALVIGKSWGFQLHSVDSGMFVWLLTALLSSCKTWNIGISFDVGAKRTRMKCMFGPGVQGSRGGSWFGLTGSKTKKNWSLINIWSVVLQAIMRKNIAVNLVDMEW